MARKRSLGFRGIERDATELGALLNWQAETITARNVLRYGAKGDGTTDDTAAIQLALDDANTAGGGIVHLPMNSTFIVGLSGDATNDGIHVYSNTALIGGGPSTIIKMADSSDILQLIYAGSADSQITIANLQLDGNKANQTINLLHGIRLDDSTDIMIEGIIAHDFKGTTGGGNEGAGIVIRGAAAYEARATISNCIAYDIGGYGIGTYRAGGVLITNCLSYDNDSMGFSLSGSTTTNRKNTISNCAAWDNGQVGFNLELQASVVVSGCVSDGHNVTGLGGYRIQAGERIIIADCVSNVDEVGVLFTSSISEEPTHVILNGLVIISPDGDGIEVDANAGSANRIEVVNCIIDDAGGTGIDVSANNQNVVISNNMVFGSTGNGIRAQNTGRIVVNNNACQSNTGSGIRISSSTGTVTVTGNNCQFNDLHGISVENISEERGAAVSGNNCHNNSQGTGNTTDGISINTSKGCAVTGNVCSDDQATATQRWGIDETGTCDHNTYVGNVMRGNSTGALSEGGANNKAAHNIGSATHDT